MRAIRELLDQRSRLLEASLLTDAEDRPQDHVERDRPQPLVQRKRLAHGPGRRSPARQSSESCPPAADVLSVERRQKQLAVAHVGLVVEREHGIAADGRLQHRLARLSGMERACVARENLANQFRVGDADDRPHTGEPRGAHRPIAAGEPADVSDRVKRVADTVDDRGHPRPGKLTNLHNARRYHPASARGDRRSPQASAREIPRRSSSCSLSVSPLGATPSSSRRSVRSCS